MQYIVAAFYHFFPFDDRVERRAELRELMAAQNIKGTILLAPEGINGTVAGKREGIDALMAYLCSHPGMAGLQHKESQNDTQPFGRAKVRLKKEAIAFDMNHGQDSPTGTYVQPAEWNDLICQPGILVLDARNTYEVELGTFEGAVDPQIPTFKALADYAEKHLDPQTHTKIATFCTGGIRCEKFTSYLRSKGFEEVFQLRGGILKYLEEIPESESLWRGQCFVFDERVAVGHGLKPRGESI